MTEIQLTLPAHWATYMINGDATSYDLTDQDIDKADAICELYGSPVGCSEEPEFTYSWRFDCPMKFHGDSLIYTFLIRE